MHAPSSQYSQVSLLRRLLPSQRFEARNLINQSPNQHRHASRERWKFRVSRCEAAGFANRKLRIGCSYDGFAIDCLRFGRSPPGMRPLGIWSKKTLVRAVGIEPTLLAEPDFESGASTSSTTPATGHRIAAAVAFAKQRGTPARLHSFYLLPKLRPDGFRFTFERARAGPWTTNVQGRMHRARHGFAIAHAIFAVNADFPSPRPLAGSSPSPAAPGKISRCWRTSASGHCHSKPVWL